MKKYIYLFFLLLVAVTTNAQVIKFSNGVSLSSMPSSQSDMLSRYIAKYYVSVGYDYFEHKHFYLSSEIGYTSLGSRGNNTFINLTPVKISESWNYLHINTTFRLKYSLNKTHFYVGCGPKLDILTSSNKFKNVFFSNLVGYQMNNLSFGGKLEVGGAYDYKKIRLGLNASYLLNIGSVGSGGDSGYLKFRRNALLFALSIGYKL